MNEEIMNNEVEVNETTNTLEEISSGNKFNYGIAAVGAAVLGGIVAGGIAIGKKIKAKKAAKSEAKDGEEPAAEEEKKPKEKGLKLGKNKKLVVIDRRPKKEDTEEDNEE